MNANEKSQAQFGHEDTGHGTTGAAEHDTTASSDDRNETTTAANEPGGGGTRAAAREFGDALGRVWSEARQTLHDVGDAWRQHGKSAQEEMRSAASETRETLGEAYADMGELGGELADDARELGRAVSADVSRYVRRNPMRSLAIAVAAGALVAYMLRGRAS